MLLVVKNPPASAGNIRDLGSVAGLRRPPGGGHGDPPTPGFLPGESHGQRSLVGYSSQDCKESDTPEQLTHTQPTDHSTPALKEPSRYLVPSLFLTFPHCPSFAQTSLLMATTSSYLCGTSSPRLRLWETLQESQLAKNSLK